MGLGNTREQHRVMVRARGPIPYSSSIRYGFAENSVVFPYTITRTTPSTFCSRRVGVADFERALPAMSKLYVGNIPEGAKDKEIQELFQAFGEVEEVALLRGYGFVVSEQGALFRTLRHSV